MTNPRKFSGVGRRLRLGLLAGVLAVAGSVAVGTPSQANVSCDVTAHDVYYPTSPTSSYYVLASITNTRATASTGWVVYMYFPPGSRVSTYWNVSPMPEYGDWWFSAGASRQVIQPGQSGSFGFLVDLPPGVSYTPTTAVCSLF